MNPINNANKLPAKMVKELRDYATASRVILDLALTAAQKGDVIRSKFAYEMAMGMRQGSRCFVRMWKHSRQQSGIAPKLSLGGRPRFNVN